MLISLIFSRFFYFNFIIQYWLFIFALSYTMLLFVIWAVVSAAVACLTLGTHILFVTYCFFSIFWRWPVLCFQIKLMMMIVFVSASTKSHILGSHVRKSSCRLENCCAYICAVCVSTPNRICLTLYDVINFNDITCFKLIWVWEK